jgi:hypothetical protein
MTIYNKISRLQKSFDLEYPDRPAILGGWLAAPEHIWTITGCSPDEYWGDPFHWGLEAERLLGSDGLVSVFQPVARGAYRCVDGRVLEERAAYTVESVLAYIEKLPDPEKLAADFDEDRTYAEFLAEYQSKQAQCGDILWCPADWEIIPTALWVLKFGYETALITMAQYPEEYRKLIRYSAERGHLRSRLIARAIREGHHPQALMTGEDICSQRGPMVSPNYLRQEYFPLLEYALAPLIEVKAKVVWHCDGDVRPILDDILSCGIGGLQGFQRECGMDLEWIADLKSGDGEPLLIFGPISVTKTLPYGTPEDVSAEVKLAMDYCRDKASLVFFTSNTITPDIPLENILALWNTVQESTWQS